MAEISILILEGADRGKSFPRVKTPISVGREEGNSIRLNDERVSRYHLKIQEDQAKLILTDLESTNGTKVNGEDVRLRLVRIGDVISLGRSVLLLGAPAEGRRRPKPHTEDDLSHTGSMDLIDMQPQIPVDCDFDLNVEEASAGAAAEAALRQAPDLPSGLTPVQRADLGEILEYAYRHLRDLLASVHDAPEGNRITLDNKEWQRLLDLQGRLAIYLRRISEPDESHV